MKHAYARCSSRDQNLARQLEALEKFGVDIIYQEKISGKDANRPELQRMLSSLKAGDIVVVLEISRLGRSLHDLINIVNLIKETGCTFICLKEGIDTSTAMGRLLFNIMGSFAEMERENILERQRDGIRIAREQGKYNYRLKKEQLLAAIEQRLTIAEMATEFKCPRLTVQRTLTRYGLSDAYKQAKAARKSDMKYEMIAL